MAEVAQMQKQEVPTKAPTNGRCVIKGRLVNVRRAGDNWFHLVVMPAPDAYSNPSTVEIMSKRRLAEKEEDVSLVCQVSGFRRSYKSTDRETGEIKTVYTADNKLVAVE